MPLIVYFVDVYKRVLRVIWDIEFRVPDIKEATMGDAMNRLVQFIIDNQWLPVELARKEFNWSGETCTLIWNRLDEWGITYKDKADNNKRKLMPLTDDELVTAVRYSTTPGDLATV